MWTVLLVTTTASAFSCYDVEVGPPVPSDDAVGVPTNARVWYAAGSDVSRPTKRFALQQLADDGVRPYVEVDAEYEYRTGWLQPVEPLAPNTDYMVVAFDAPHGGIAQFTTGAGPDHTPPGATTLTDAGWLLEGWGAYYGGEATSVWFTASTQTDEPMVWEFEVSPLYWETVLSTDATLRLTNWGCGGPRLDLTPPFTLTARARAIDLAGNVGPWSETATVATRADGAQPMSPARNRSGGCTHAPPPWSGWAMRLAARR
ncbi:MAG: hypothetical protein ACI8PZ_002650 [Myxococcota bacterium]|jgi:hypothetical protein